MVVRGTRYTKLECVGRGGSSKVGFSTVLMILSTIHSPVHRTMWCNFWKLLIPTSLSTTMCDWPVSG